MDRSRRAVLGGLVTAGGAALAGCATTETSTSNSSVTQPLTAGTNDLASLPTLDRLLFNTERAQALLEENQVDLLLCAQPDNIYYLTNQRPVSEMLGSHGYVYAAYAAKGNGKPTHIEGQLGFYFTAPTDAVSALVNRKYYGLPEDFAQFAKLSAAKEFAQAKGVEAFAPRVHSDAPLSPSEARRLALAFDAAQPVAAGIEGAVFQLLLETDFPNKTIAIDDPILRGFIARSGLDLQIVDGEQLIRRIRLQKTPMEVEMMRYAAQSNAESGRLAAQSVAEGATYEELRREFARNSGERAMQMKYMMIDNLVPILTPGAIERGRSFLIDCVSVFEGYHGDYGRTVCVGEPNRRMQQIVNALSHVWDRTLPALKPGTRFSELRTLSAQLIKDSQINTNLVINPHSVGLNHTDEPSALPFSYFLKEDLVLEENMVLSVDMPLLDTGLGGSAHLEDLVLITRDGPELLNRSDDRLIVV